MAGYDEHQTYIPEEMSPWFPVGPPMGPSVLNACVATSPKQKVMIPKQKYHILSKIRRAIGPWALDPVLHKMSDFLIF